MLGTLFLQDCARFPERGVGSHFLSFERFASGEGGEVIGTRLFCKEALDLCACGADGDRRIDFSELRVYLLQNCVQLLGEQPYDLPLRCACLQRLVYGAKFALQLSVQLSCLGLDKLCEKTRVQARLQLLLHLRYDLRH